MSRPNVHKLPPYLRKDKAGYFIDYFHKSEGRLKRKRKRLGVIPLAQAKKILAENMEAIVGKRLLGVQTTQITFEEAVDSFLEHSRTRKRSFKRDLILVGHLKGFFGGITLANLTPEMLEKYQAHRLQNAVKQGKKLSGATVNRECACFKAVIRRAIRNRRLDFNPIAGFEFLPETPRNRTLAAEEYKRLQASCSPHMRTMVQLAYVTGMRRNEILGLRWDQVNFDEGFISLKAEDTKTHEAREIPLDADLIDLLQKVPRTLNNPHVFTFRGRSLSDPKGAFRMACKRAGIADFHFHDLRHCAVTNFRKAGVPRHTIMSISGHKTESVFNRYDRIDRDDRREALKSLRRHGSPEFDTYMTRRASEGLDEKIAKGGTTV